MSSPREENGRLQRSEWFSVMLYPKEDIRHKAIFNFICSEKGIFRKVVWINHDRDIYTEDTEEHKKGDLKKEHIHCLFKLNKQSTSNGVIGLFAGDISFVEVVNNSTAKVLYFLHRTYKAIKEGKPMYFENELFGDPDIINSALAKNDNFVQFTELVRLLKSTTHYSLSELVSKITDLDECKQDSLFSALKSWQSFISTMSNQEIKYKEFFNDDCNR